MLQQKVPENPDRMSEKLGEFIRLPRHHLPVWPGIQPAQYQQHMPVRQPENFKRAAEELFRSPRAGVGLPKEGLES